MNSKRTAQKVALSTISGVPGTQKFHFKDIPENWMKVDVREALYPKTALMFPNDDIDQNIIGDAVGSAALWDQKHIKIAS
jgi:hypothetical protein